MRLRNPLAALLVTGVLAAGAAIAQEEADLAEGRVKAELDQRDDARIRKRLQATFETLDSLRAVEVEVRAGVVRLRGTVDSLEARALAGDLARQIEGVAAVENRIEETTSLRRRLGTALRKLESRSYDFVARLPLLVVAAVVFLLFGAFARLATSWEAPFRRLSSNVFVQDLTRQVAFVTILVAGALLALEILDATALVGAVLGAAGLAGLAVGFAFRDLVENYIASILLSLRQPFAPNEHVRIESVEGKVVRLTSRATVLLSFDGNHIRVPNSVVFKATIENFTRKPERRFSFAVGVGAGEDLAAAQELGARVLRKMDGVLGEPEPVVLVDELGDSSVVLRFFGWVDQRQADFFRVRSEAIRLVKEVFDAAAIEMPEPISRVRVERPSEPKEVRRAPAPEPVARDIAPDRHLEREIEQERAAEEPDLLQPEGPQE